MRRAAIVIAAVLCIGGGWLFAQSRSPALTGQDYAEIQQLYARYNQGSDLRDGDMWLSAFASDGVFTLPGGREYAGQKALAEYRSSSFATTPQSAKRRHWNSSLVVTPTASGAQGRAYFIVFDVSGKQPVPTSSGYYDDLFVKTSGGWKIKRRTVNSDASPPAASR
jgi:uncharacterized protein (TIGR02246 family)